MKNLSAYQLFFLLSVLFFFLPDTAQTGGKIPGGPDFRPSVLAGTWYPGSRVSLEKTIRDYMQGVSVPSPEGDIRALIVPHAGYRYSGRVAAHAFRLLEGSSIERVILIGPSHRMCFHGASVNLQAGYETPLGIVPVDQEFGRELIKAAPEMRWNKEAHILEHCLEIQLPFLQMTLKDFKIVPILLSEMNFEACRRLALTIIDTMRGKGETLILASTDLSHYYSSERAQILDHRFIDRIKEMDPQKLAKDLSAGKCEACGYSAVITTLLAANNLEADRAEILCYSHSGETTGDNVRVVGYLSAALIKSYYRDPHRK